MGERRLKAAVLEWSAIASASAALACLIGWGASIATQKAGFTMTFPSEFGLSVSDGALEFGEALGHMREAEYWGDDFIAPAEYGWDDGIAPGWRLPGLRHRSYTRLQYNNFSTKMEKVGYLSITSVSLLFPGASFGVAAWLLIRSYRRTSRRRSSIVHG